MSRPALEVADILRTHLDDLLALRGGRLTGAEGRVVRALLACRTAALGGHVLRCDHCAHEVVAYNSCRNRHCPKCQAKAREDWLAERQRDLLPVPYFHVVFTLPHELSRLVLGNKARLYDLLFRSAADALRELAADPRHLGAQIGLLAVLHTWGQTLELHPHVHCVVPGGGLSPDGSRWIASRDTFFLPVRPLARLFRGKFLAGLKALHRQQQLAYPEGLHELHDPATFAAHLRPLYRKDWVVYSKPPFGGPAHVLKYLARYTHRVAIANSRLLSLRDGRVTFRYKDYAHGSRQRTMSLQAGEFLRRFLVHVLPRHFVRIRHYGFLANRRRQDALARCRHLLGVAAPPPRVEVADVAQPCPRCRQGRLLDVLALPAEPTLTASALDTS
ncbi:MAG TPA: IS91 family transposase [Dehalococcoidia bacterium]|nr:IS91 family transposase [Dehalococcoidia bacterium]